MPIYNVELDLIIRGCTLFDGGSPTAAGRAADIGITDGLISAIGDLSTVTATSEYDAAGMVASPGFVDIHTHSDISVGYNPQQASSISMGVTTQIVGNCGFSIGFATDTETFSSEKRWLAPHKSRIDWSSFGEHLDHIESRGAGNNIVPLAGHGTLRKRVMGQDDRPPSPTEMREMQRELNVAMEFGAWGLSSGLEYPPSSYATEDELIDLCRVVGNHGGIYATHLRNEGDTVVEAVQEALNVASAASVPLQLSHHKTEGMANWGKVNTTLQMVDQARNRGADIQMDQYPYTAFMTSLSVQTLPRAERRLAHPNRSRPGCRNLYRGQVFARRCWRHTRSGMTSLVTPSSPWSRIQIGVP